MLRFGSSNRNRAVWTAFALLAIASPGVAVANDAGPLLGRWRTQAQNGVIEIHRCGKLLCGRVVDAAALRRNPDQRDVKNGDATLRTRRIKNLVVLQNFAPNGGGEWKGGPVYDPATGDGARLGYLELAGANTLKVKGCVAPFLCRTQNWTRIP